MLTDGIVSEVRSAQPVAASYDKEGVAEAPMWPLPESNHRSNAARLFSSFEDGEKKASHYIHSLIKKCRLSKAFNDKRQASLVDFFKH